MMALSWRFIRVWQRNRDVFFRLWHSEAPGAIAEPIIILLAMGVGLGAYVGFVDGQKYIEFIAPGIIASYAWGDDYHDVMTSRLQELGTFIEAEISGPVAYRAYVDAGPLLERELATRTGIGFVGKNTNLRPG